MNRFLWVQGRLSWPLVCTVVFLTVSLVCADFFWRFVVLPAETFLVLTILIDAAAAAILAGLYVMLRRHRLRQE